MSAQTDKIKAAVAAMARCDALTLAAGLAMLPDYMENGTGVVLGAAARILAERFADPMAATEQLKKAVRKNIEIISETKKQNDHEIPEN